MQETQENKLAVELKTQDGRFRVLMFEDTPLGKGNYGDCYLGLYPFKAELVVVKKIFCKSQKEIDFLLWKKNYENEITLLHKASIKNKVEEFSNIVNVEPIKIISQKHRHGYIIMEYCSGGSLYDLIIRKKASKKWFTFKEFSTIMLDVLDGYDQIASVGILHQDLKPDNIFINKNKFKIGDFGLSYKINGDKAKRGGTQSYNAPEKYNFQKKVTEKSDIYALGIMFYRLIFDFHPYYTEDELKEFKAIEDREAEIDMQSILKGKKSYQESKISDVHIFLKFILSRKMKEHAILLYFENSERQALNQIIELIKNMIKIKDEERYSLIQVKQEIEKINLKKHPIEVQQKLISAKYKAIIVKQSMQLTQSVTNQRAYYNQNRPVPEKIQEVSKKTKIINLKTLYIFQLTNTLERETKEDSFYDQCIYLIAKLKVLNYCLTYHAYCEILELIKQFQPDILNEYYLTSQDYLLNNTKNNKLFLENEVRNYFKVRKQTVDQNRYNLMNFIKNEICSQDLCLDQTNKYQLKIMEVILKLLNIKLESQESLDELEKLKAYEVESLEKMKNGMLDENELAKQLVEIGFKFTMIEYD